MNMQFDVEFLLGHMNYWLFVVLMMTGLYIVVARGNLLKKIVGLNIFQAAVFMLYISMGKISGGTQQPIATGNPDEILLQPPSPCSDTHGHCCRHRHNIVGARVDRSYQ